MSVIAGRRVFTHRPYLGRAGWNLGLVVLIVAIGVVGALTSSRFLSADQLSGAAQAAVVSGLLALGLSIVVLVGEIDISLTSNLALVTVVIGLLSNAHQGAGVIIVAALAAGTLLGLINGLLVAMLGMPSLAVTLGTLGAYQGAAYLAAGNASLTSFPNVIASLGANYIGTIPIAVIILAIFALALGALLGLTTQGRALYGVGRAAEAVRRNGVPVAGTKLVAFAIGGFSAGLGALIFVGYYGSGGGDSASGTLLTVVTPVALGGFDIYGGSGRMSGVVLAWILLALIQDLMGLLYVATPVQNIVIGALLLISMTAGYVRAGRGAREFATRIGIGRQRRDGEGD